MKIGRAALLVLLATALACGDQGPVSGPGTMTATLTGPNGPEGAALVRLFGDGIGAITAVGSTDVHAQAAGSTVRIVLINQSGGQLAFRVAVPDTTAPPTFEIAEVAGPDDQLRAGLGSYSLEFSR